MSDSYDLNNVHTLNMYSLRKHLETLQTELTSLSTSLDDYSELSQLVRTVKITHDARAPAVLSMKRLLLATVSRHTRCENTYTSISKKWANFLDREATNLFAYSSAPALQSQLALWGRIESLLTWTKQGLTAISVKISDEQIGWYEFDKQLSSGASVNKQLTEEGWVRDT